MASIIEPVAPAQCVGPDYRPIAQKPTATISTEITYENVHILPQTSQLIALLTYVFEELQSIARADYGS